jgi:tetratricopeptide (TPR) repeat protein
MLRIGEYHFEKKDYRDAADAYDEFLTMNPKSARAPHTMALAAQAMYESFKGVPYDETPLVEAEARYKALLAQYPDEARKCRATDMVREIVTIRGERAYETAKFYERTGRPQSAIFYYRQVAEDFPSTVWASEARAKVGVAPRQPSIKPAAAEIKPAAAEIKPAAAPTGMTEVKFGQAKPGEQPTELTPEALKSANKRLETTVSVPEGGKLLLGGSIPAAAPETKPATAPAVQSASQPAAEIKPAATAPHQGPQGPARPVDLEKLANPSANPSSKGQSK